MTTTITSDTELDLGMGYQAELVDLEERLNQDAEQRLNEHGKPIDPARWIWKFYLHDAVTGEPIERKGKRGGLKPVEVWLWSSRNTRYDENGTYTAQARRYMHALCGQVITTEEVRALIQDSDLPFGLCGRRCLVTLDWYAPASGRKRLSVIALRDLQGTLWWAKRVNSELSAGGSAA